MLKTGDKVTLGDGGPEMIVWKVIEGEVECRWYDAFGERHQRKFHAHMLKKRNSKDDE